jgi:hypothetical protein
MHGEEVNLPRGTAQPKGGESHYKPDHPIICNGKPGPLTATRQHGSNGLCIVRRLIKRRLFHSQQSLGIGQGTIKGAYDRGFPHAAQYTSKRSGRQGCLPCCLKPSIMPGDRVFIAHSEWRSSHDLAISPGVFDPITPLGPDCQMRCEPPRASDTGDSIAWPDSSRRSS